jgi:multidrug efflux pump subunit AcrA (membrane-fusion protein)
LFEKGFVTQTYLETDELTLKRKQVTLEQTNNTKSLYIQYEFPKQAEKLVSAYIQALWKYIRIQKVAKSRLAQAEAKLNSAKAQFALELRKKKELEEQIAKCTIRATKPGLVVYGGGEDRFMQDRIQEGAIVRERQVIITIPDTSVMRVRTKIHESNIKRVAPGQRAKIKVDAFPEKELFGTVEKVSVLPNAQNRWLNPDLKVYDTFVVIEGTHPWLKPGMTAQVEIIVAELDNVLYIPLQCVVNIDGRQACYVQKGDKIELRFITVGDYNDSFIEVKDGLKEGEMVLLRSPTTSLNAPVEKRKPNRENEEKDHSHP